MAWLAQAVAALVGLFSLPVSATQGAVRESQPAPPPPIVVSGPCAEWHDTAVAVGWDEGDWPHVARIMRCESNCDPNAHNRSGASGLMQIMPMWWHGRDPYDPAVNLTMALEIRHSQGWPAWSCNSKG